jgi:hypothetical protein
VGTPEYRARVHITRIEHSEIVIGKYVRADGRGIFKASTAAAIARRNNERTIERSRVPALILNPRVAANWEVEGQQTNKLTPWHLVCKRTIPTERQPLADEI